MKKKDASSSAMIKEKCGPSTMHLCRSEREIHSALTNVVPLSRAAPSLPLQTSGLQNKLNQQPFPVENTISSNKM